MPQVPEREGSQAAHEEFPARTRSPNPAADLIPDQRARVNVASFETYAAAQRAVDFRSGREFPVERVAVVGEGLQTIEQGTGRLDWGRAAGLGLGLFIGLIFAALDWGSGVSLS